MKRLLILTSLVIIVAYDETKFMSKFVIYVDKSRFSFCDVVKLALVTRCVHVSVNVTEHNQNDQCIV